MRQGWHGGLTGAGRARIISRSCGHRAGTRFPEHAHAHPRLSASPASPSRSPSPRPPSPSPPSPRCRNRLRRRPRRWAIRSPTSPRPTGATPRPAGQGRRLRRLPRRGRQSQRPTVPAHRRHARALRRAAAGAVQAGVRTSGMAAVMAPMAAPLSAQDMRDVGAYFAQQKAGAACRRHRDRLGPVRRDEVLRRRAEAVPRRRSGPRHPGVHGLPRPRRRRQPRPRLPAHRRPAVGHVVRRLQEYRTGTTTEQDHHLFDA